MSQGMTDIANQQRPLDTAVIAGNVQDIADAALRDLLSADAVLPDQFWEAKLPSSCCTGEVALMWAVFADGIDCFRRNVGATAGQGMLDFEDAEAWIFVTDWDWPFSFVNLCEVFGFNPNSVRWQLQLWKQKRQQRVPRHRYRPVTRHAA